MNRSFSSDTLDEAAEVIWGALFGLGAIKDTLAFSQASLRLYDAGLIGKHPIESESVDDDFVKAAFQRALSYDFLDMPKTGQYRAILKNAADYERDDWEKCIVGFMGDNEDKRLGRQDIIKGAVAWAKNNLGLQLRNVSPKSRVWTQVEIALNQAINDRVINQTIFYGVERLQLVA